MFLLQKSNSSSPYVSPLAGNGDPPPVLRPGLRERRHGRRRVLRRRAIAVQEEAADHGAGPPLPGLAVDGRHVLRVLRQPPADVPAEGGGGGEGGRAVVGGRVAPHPAVEEGGGVLGAGGEVRAKVVNLKREWKEDF